MRIVAIRGRDLASLKGDFAVELDQPPLSNLGLFAIHGPVGSGKSTLLDAMCLALFGRTPRLSGQGGAPLSRGDDDVDKLRSNDPSTLVRRGAPSAMAEVDFVGVDGRLYRARWEVRRARAVKGKPGRLQAEVHSLVRRPRIGIVEDEERFGDKNTEVRELVADRLGLSFDELCRSVLLAQGGFQSFLAAKPNERAMLLEKVTGTDIYSRLSIAAYDRGRQAQQRHHELVEKRQACGALDDDGRQRLEFDVVNSAGVAVEAEAVARGLEMSRERRAARRDVEKAAAAVDDADVVIARVEGSRARALEVLEHAKAQLAAASPLLQQARHAHQQLAVAARADDEARAAARAATTRWTAATTTAQQARAKLAAATTTLTTTRATKLALEQRVGAVSFAQAVAHALTSLVQATTALSGHAAVVEAAARAVDDAAAVADIADVARVAAIDAVGAALPAGVAVDDVEGYERAVLTALVAADVAAADVVESELRASRMVLDRFRAASLHERARKALKDEEPCPVCGSAEHPWAHKVVDDPVAGLIVAEQDNVLRLEGALRTHRDRASANGGRLSTSSTTPEASLPTMTLSALLATSTTLTAARPLLTTMKRAQLAHADAIAAVDSAVAAHAVQVAHKEAAEHGVEQARATLHTLNVDVGDADSAALKARLTALTGELAALKRAVDDEARAAAAVEVAARAVDDDDAGVVRADGDRAAADAVAVERGQHRRAVDDVASEALRAVHGLPGADDGSDVEVLAKRWHADVVDAEAVLAVQTQQLTAATTTRAGHLALFAERRDRYERLGGNDNASDVGDDVLDARTRQARADASAARDAASMARATLAHDDQQRHKATALDEAIAVHDVESRVWIDLADLIGAADGAKFRQFAQGLTLDALVGHANEHLTTLAPRYRLRRTGSTQQKHDLDLVVVDTEAGDDVRSTATLSGGESFLVSLALALGLSSLSANEGARGRVESLFIDEGFSALDQETLDVALAAFDALRQTGRQIGVISHVPLLVERLGAQVRIIPMGGGASRVEVHAG